MENNTEKHNKIYLNTYGDVALYYLNEAKNIDKSCNEYSYNLIFGFIHVHNIIELCEDKALISEDVYDTISSLLEKLTPFIDQMDQFRNKYEISPDTLLTLSDYNKHLTNIPNLLGYFNELYEIFEPASDIMILLIKRILIYNTNGSLQVICDVYDNGEENNIKNPMIEEVTPEDLNPENNTITYRKMCLNSYGIIALCHFKRSLEFSRSSNDHAYNLLYGVIYYPNIMKLCEDKEVLNEEVYNYILPLLEKLKLLVEQINIFRNKYNISENTLRNLSNYIKHLDSISNLPEYFNDLYELCEPTSDIMKELLNKIPFHNKNGTIIVLSNITN